MGLYDRDYYRNEPAGGGAFGGASVCKWLVIVNVVVYVLQVVTLGRGELGLSRWLLLDPVSVLHNYEVWRLVTYAFCHDINSPWHILFNMWMLWMFGKQVEAIYGSREFLKFYLAAAVIAGVVYLLFGLAVSHLGALWGASGAVLATTVVCAMYYPTQRMLFLFVIPIELRWLVFIAVIFDLLPVLHELGGRQALDNVGHAAHLGGALYGFLYKYFDLRFDRLLRGLKAPRMRNVVRAATRSTPAVRLYEPSRPVVDSAEFNLQVDELLAKISEKGEASLTDDEREVLKEASRRYERQ